MIADIVTLVFICAGAALSLAAACSHGTRSKVLSGHSARNSSIANARLAYPTDPRGSSVPWIQGIMTMRLDSGLCAAQMRRAISTTP